MARARRLNGLAAVYRYQWRYDHALSNLEKVQTLRDRLADPRGVAIALNNRGELYRLQQRFEEAHLIYRQALDIHRGLNNRKAEGNTLNNIAVVYERQGDYTSASNYFEEALNIAREQQTGGVESAALSGLGRVSSHDERYGEALAHFQQALDIARKAGLPTGAVGILTNMAMVYEAQGHFAVALEHYTAAMDLLETMRIAAGSQAGKAGFIGRYFMLYDDAVDLHFRQGHSAEAFYVSERGRARAFLDSLTTGQVRLYDEAIGDTLDEAGYAAILAIIESGGQLAAEEAQSSTSPVLRAAQVQALLDEQTTLVAYYRLRDNILAFILTRDSFKAVALNVDPDEVAREITIFRDFSDIDVTYPDSAATLYELLIAPLKDSLTTPHLTIIPHQELHYLPFAALTDGNRFLIDDYALTLLPSASTLPFIRQNAAPTTPDDQPSILILGNPAPIGTDPADPSAAELNTLSELPFAEEEAIAIAELFGVAPLLGDDATEGAVRERAGEANILHLAAHGRLNSTTPLASLIALAPDEPLNASDSHDGRLTVAETYDLNLENSDLVVLSACQTNLGDLSTGDELVGLTRALFFAGTPSVVASLWNVEDEATSLLMHRFYIHLRSGLGKADALRQAQLEVREQYPQPYYWSSFVLSGDGGEVRPIPLPTTAPDKAEISFGPDQASERSQQINDVEIEAAPTASIAQRRGWPTILAGGGVLLFIVAIIALLGFIWYIGQHE